ncbi:hypothetical protein HXX76_014328 [Chlamydomonas incerta]|uniref:Uncharacterized protein n=1 Tax=Chlamydomonas incerta TaxID=51695 RepID=A0A835VTD4_CHLIN|nr:hypothetical protein HXX76_014328 [Chlamydomonas incerta]|eukprot:KAG2424601.1 hypothetical protein HXX76_014328 [Chlamydomonas incerta]
MPLGAVQQMPESQQAAVVAGIFAALAASTYLCSTAAGPALADNLPWLYHDFVAKRAVVLGGLFAAAGVAHFTSKDAFESMYPRPGAWGFWNLPGSAAFHVEWTGVAEILGGGALAATGAVPALAAAYPWLQPAAAAGLFALTTVVTPSNIYMFTHNAPGPAPKVIPWPGHFVRLVVMQGFLLSQFWDMAHP